MEFPKRKNLRLENYDYSKNGGYFVTICTHNRSRLFGEITGNVVGANLCVRPNEPDKMIENLKSKINIRKHKSIIML